MVLTEIFPGNYKTNSVYFEGDTAYFVRMSPLSRKIHQGAIPGVTLARFEKWMEGSLIQDVFPELTANEREFIMTGITPQEWEEAFGRK